MPAPSPPAPTSAFPSHDDDAAAENLAAIAARRAETQTRGGFGRTDFDARQLNARVAAERRCASAMSVRGARVTARTTTIRGFVER
tara:strand:+ start:175 stop:432 length:258 start_codon:yes stop_codon:yes gene_type:complete